MDDSRELKIAILRREIDPLWLEEHCLLRLVSTEKEDSAFAGEMIYHFATIRHKIRDASRDLAELEKG